jgi:hypothetical protein
MSRCPVHRAGIHVPTRDDAIPDGCHRTVAGRQCRLQTAHRGDCE